MIDSVAALERAKLGRMSEEVQCILERHRLRFSPSLHVHLLAYKSGQRSGYYRRMHAFRVSAVELREDLQRIHSTCTYVYTKYIIQEMHIESQHFTKKIYGATSVRAVHDDLRRNHRQFNVPPEQHVAKEKSRSCPWVESRRNTTQYPVIGPQKRTCSQHSNLQTWHRRLA